MSWYVCPLQPGPLYLAAARLPRVRALWRGVTARLFDPYRPELHYMRGPGPRFRELQARRGVETDEQSAKGKGDGRQSMMPKKAHPASSAGQAFSRSCVAPTAARRPHLSFSLVTKIDLAIARPPMQRAVSLNITSQAGAGTSETKTL